MGGSGAGKTSLLNVLSGLENPSAGEVLINNINLHKEKEKLEGVIGYIAQDDLLLEELTVFQNLFYNAKLCFGDLSEKELIVLVDKMLNNLGLFEIKDIKVGSPLNKKISGGQRKRLNIALELIREPSILFVDEPTSGLSSRDSAKELDRWVPSALALTFESSTCTGEESSEKANAACDPIGIVSPPARIPSVVSTRPRAFAAII